MTQETGGYMDMIGKVFETREEAVVSSLGHYMVHINRFKELEQKKRVIKGCKYNLMELLKEL